MILTTDPRQMDLAQYRRHNDAVSRRVREHFEKLDRDTAGMLRRRAAAPLRPRKAQLPADHGLFSDEAAQLDLVEVSLWR